MVFGWVFRRKKLGTAMDSKETIFGKTPEGVVYRKQEEKREERGFYISSPSRILLAMCTMSRFFSEFSALGTAHSMM